MLIGLSLIISIPFMLDNSFLNDSTNKAIYITAKTMFGCFFLISWALVLFGKLKESSKIIIVSIVSFAQLIPLLARFILPMPNGALWSNIVVAISLICTIAITGLLIISNSMMVKNDKKYEGKSIEVKDDSQMYDKNNHFKGISKE